jgi:hypothetical protein
LPAPSQNHGTRNTEYAPRIEPVATPPPSTTDQPTPTRASKPKARNGKIARLAKPLRDMVNLMLQNNIQHSMIAEALEEHGVRVTKRNISNWKTRGGYDDWRLEQERITTTRLRQDNITDYLRPTDATHLPEVGLQLTATQLCEFLLNPQTQQQLTSAPEKFARTISNLCRVTRHLHLLQKYRDDSARELGHKHNPERVKRKIDHQLETTRDIYSAEKLGETINDPDISHRDFIPKNPFSHAAQHISEQESPRPAFDSSKFLSDMVEALKNYNPLQPPTPPNSNAKSTSQQDDEPCS